MPMTRTTTSRPRMAATYAPGTVRDFANGIERLVKTDSVDARMLAELAQVLNQRPDALSSRCQTGHNSICMR